MDTTDPDIVFDAAGVCNHCHRYETLARLRKHGAELVSTEVVQYEDTYRLCYIRGPEGLLIGLAEELV